MQQVVGDLVSQRGDRLRIMPLGPYRAPRAGGIAQTARAGIFYLGLARRGKTAPLEPNGKCPVMVKFAPHIGSVPALFELLIPLDDPAVLARL